MDEDFEVPAANEMMDEDMDLPDDAPMMKVGEEKEIGNQGLKKKLLKEGEGWNTPENGDEVEGNLSFVFLLFFLISNYFYLAFKVFFFTPYFVWFCCSSLYWNVVGWYSV